MSEIVGKAYTGKFTGIIKVGCNKIRFYGMKDLKAKIAELSKEHSEISFMFDETIPKTYSKKEPRLILCDTDKVKTGRVTILKEKEKAFILAEKEKMSINAIAKIIGCYPHLIYKFIDSLELKRKRLIRDIPSLKLEDKPIFKRPEAVYNNTQWNNL